MRKLAWVGALMGILMLSGGPTRAEQQAVSPVAWQSVIAAQIQAFRDHDAPSALMFASEEFHKTFSDPREFFLAIINSGYEPIMDSRSQTFGPYQMVSPNLVLQEVKLTGKDQVIYEAIFQLSKEATGWRVHGVQLMKTPDIEV